MRLNFGLIDSVLTRNLVWAKVAATAQRMAARTSGPTVLPMAAMPCTPSSAETLPVSRGSSPTVSRHSIMNLPSSLAKKLVSSQRVRKVPSRLTTATASLLIKTLPFFRSSRRFFGVAFSVLFPSANVHPPLPPCPASVPAGPHREEGGQFPLRAVIRRSGAAARGGC